MATVQAKAANDQRYGSLRDLDVLPPRPKALHRELLEGLAGQFEASRAFRFFCLRHGANITVREGRGKEDQFSSSACEQMRASSWPR